MGIGGSGTERWGIRKQEGKWDREVGIRKEEGKWDREVGDQEGGGEVG